VIRSVTLAPGTARAYVDGEWAGALVVLARGRLELEARDGRRVRLRSGAVLWLAGLPLRALHNRWGGPAVLLVVTRDPADGRGNAGRAPGVFESMTLPLLILFAAGTLLPCLGIWLADERARLQDR
jgi:hypothetical protein